MNKSIDDIIDQLRKNTNPNYKAVKQGIKKKYNSDEMVYQRILKKTEDPIFAEKWLQMRQSPNWRDKVWAEQRAKYLQCLK